MPNLRRGMMAAAGAAGGSASQGTMWAWGQNEQGDLGLGTSSYTPTSSTVQVGSQTNWQSVDLDDYGICKVGCSDSATIAIDGDGKLYTWGSGGDGRGGRGNTTAVCVPTQVGARTDWATCSGGYGGWATTTGGEWWFIGGSNGFGQGGQGSTTTSKYSSPVQIGSETYWAKTAGVINMAYGITNHGADGGGKLYAVGSSASGQLGQGDTTSHCSPVQIGSDTTWKLVACNAASFVALKTDGTIWSCGLNDKGQLGDGSTTNRSSPVQIGSGTDWAYITIGWQKLTWAIKTNGTLWGWGYNYYGSVGDGSTTNRSAPVQVGSLTDWKLICGDSYTAAAVKTDGTLWTWGRGNIGNLGDGTTANRSSPVQVGSDTDWLSVGPNGQAWHMQAIRSV